MSKRTSKRTAIMLFVFGSILLILGFGLAVVTAEETRYRNFMGFSIPYKVTVYPFQPIGILVIILGISLIGGSIYQSIRKGASGSDY